MHRIRRFLLSFLTVLMLFHAPVCAVGYPVFSRQEFLQSAAQWVDTANQYVQQTKIWIDDARRIKDALQGMIEGDWTNWLSGFSNLMGSIADTQLMSAMNFTGNFFESMRDTTSVIDKAIKQGVASGQSMMDTWNFLQETVENINENGIDDNFFDAFDSVMGVINTGFRGFAATSDFSSGLLYNLGEVVGQGGMLEATFAVAEANNETLNDNLEKARESYKKAMEEYRRAVEANGPDSAEAKQWELAMNDAKEQISSYVDQIAANTEDIRKINEGYNEAISGSNDAYAGVSSMVMGLMNDTQRNLFRGTYFGSDDDAFKASLMAKLCGF